ncbi:RNA polymerase-binding protein RbpA [Saccharopolyspora sp. HNM0983]|uniref:RNA polymerase-binding protein RbpA n=1 Tax=Saccharopolyspora montiporae TaxID=2781240 RepID=A0A929B7W9_9PSEU|nr:RNA polymerase-binding protein RbpA [Saccharopolyspora sp. HNM0983]MBE9373465.1 RNA polymerase-binding protein RbpA [Saccharopolyspora sp. HNM0983]
MTGGDAIRGTRVGSGPVVGEAERGESAPCKRIDYWCTNGHRVRPSFAADAEVPAEWECPRCGLPAGQDPDDPPAARRNEPFKSHLAYVQERRSEADSTAILDEALGRLRERRGR